MMMIYKLLIIIESDIDFRPLCDDEIPFIKEDDNNVFRNEETREYIKNLKRKYNLDKLL